ncbi:MAG: metallophosphoesterase [Vicinamibacterales bacterium]
MTPRAFDVVAAAAVVLAAAVLLSRRSRRSALVLLALYGAQAACLTWASWTMASAPWANVARVFFLVALFAVLSHRIATYAFPRPPAPRDRVIVPLVHVAQAWLFLELVLWPMRMLALPASSTIDAWVLGAPLIGAAIGLAWTHRPPRVTRQRVALRSLGRPLRVVHLSDLHLGPYLPEARLAWLAETVASEAGDIVAITGDFLTLRSQRDWTPLLQFVERLQPPEGVFACLGNHDVEVADELSATLQASGVRVLRDEVAWLPGRDGLAPVPIAGLDWHVGRQPQRAYARAFADVWKAAGPDGPSIVLCHQPEAFRTAPPAFGGIMLAGHLHGGQVGISWRGRGVSLLRLFGMYDQGLFARGHGRLYSHCGTGVYGFPMRLGVPAEIAVLTLVPAGADDADGRAW